MAEALFWPAILGYGEAALAYAWPRTTRIGTWGVRLGWLAQTALLAVQAARADGFPWSSWSGSLNLFVWLVVGTYLIWGCQPRFRLLGLAVMPLAALLFLVSRLGGGTAAGSQSRYGNLFLIIHVGFVLAAFAGFTLAAALAALYLLEERRLHRHAPDILRLRLPSLVALERLTARTITVSLPLLTVGLIAGLIRLHDDHDRLDALMGAAIATWFLYLFIVAVRPSGSRTAQLALVGFALVIVTRVVLAGGHFLTLSLVGVSHHVAPVELRERVSLTPEGAASLARSLGDAVCLSTCNRTELYLAGDDGSRALSSLEELAGEPLRSVAYRMHDEDAAVHLFRVSAGLDSLVPGESEILGQVRAAYHAAAPGPLLDRVFRQALQLGKRVRTETAIGESPASVPAAAAALAEQVFGDLRDRRVLLVGAGTVGQLAASSLAARGASIVYVANRGRVAAGTLAGRFGASAVGLEAIPAVLGEVDVVLTSTSAPGLVIGLDDVPARRRSPLFFIDIAVPRDVAEAVHELPGCFVYDIDDLEAVVAETLAGRAVEAERAEQLVVEEAERFREWQASLEVVPAITSLRAHAEEIRAAELAKLPPLPSDTRATIEAVTSQMLNKLLHLPTVRMKQAAAADGGSEYADAIRHLFGLDEER